MATGVSTRFSSAHWFRKLGKSVLKSFMALGRGDLAASWECRRRGVDPEGFAIAPKTLFHLRLPLLTTGLFLAFAVGAVLDVLSRDLRRGLVDFAIDRREFRGLAHEHAGEFLRLRIRGGEVKTTKRFRLGRLISEHTRQLLLLTATPHNGEDVDFQLFLSLLDGDRLVAREIHRRSARKDKPLVRVNCASIPKELFESEFFGHVRGSFTGAIKDRAGRFETAEGGTLFLDEIGEVPLDMQGKLLRVLQEKRYERVGEDRTRSANVRIVAATNRELKKEVTAGRFREDLYYRLHVFPIQVIPLRERKDDIPLLAKHFVELSVKELKCAKPRLTRAGVVKLQSYDWPGNVRELRNVIERAVILARGGNLEFDLPIQTGASPSPARSRALKQRGRRR